MTRGKGKQMSQRERIAQLEAEVASLRVQNAQLAETLLNMARALPSAPVVIQPVVDPVPQPWNPYPQPQPWVSPFQPTIICDYISPLNTCSSN